MPATNSHHLVQGNARLLGRINHEMERQASRGWTDEESLRNLRDELHEYAGPKGQAFWLSLARLGELALWWTGSLADAGEFQAVGDLLLNAPRKTLYVQGRALPVRLRRHQPITEQVRLLAPAGANLVQWLKNRTMLVVETQPLLPTLLDDLSHWPHQAPKACGEFQQRLDRVAGALCHITSLNLPEGRSVVEHLARVPLMEAEAIKERLCRFDLQRFEALGLHLRSLLPPAAPEMAQGRGAGQPAELPSP